MPIRHVIEQGESVIQLSEEHGLFATTIWDDPANADLKARRTDMNVLLPGDEVVIPDIRPKGERVETLHWHRFRRKGIPAIFRFQIFDGETPRANQDFILEIDDVPHQGVTDEFGVLEVYLPPGAEKGTLVIGPDRFYLEIAFGHLDPISEIVGVQKRLNNLGYFCGEPDGTLNDRTRGALLAFQARFELEETGEPDEATLAKLEEIHDAKNEFDDNPEDATA